MTDIEKNQIITLRSQGNGYKKISALTGLTLEAVKSFCRRNTNASSRCQRNDSNFTALRQRNDINSTASPVDTGSATSVDTVSCLCCGKPIQQISKQKPKKFCSDRCRNKWWNSNLDLVKHRANHTFTCQHCGKTFTTYGNKLRKYCSHFCYIEHRFGGATA